jgi:hypothetical protein
MSMIHGINRNDITIKGLSKKYNPYLRDPLGHKDRGDKRYVGIRK